MELTAIEKKVAETNKNFQWAFAAYHQIQSYLPIFPGRYSIAQLRVLKRLARQTEKVCDAGLLGAPSPNQVSAMAEMIMDDPIRREREIDHTPLAKLPREQIVAQLCQASVTHFKAFQDIKGLTDAVAYACRLASYQNVYDYRYRRLLVNYDRYYKDASTWGIPTVMSAAMATFLDIAGILEPSRMLALLALPCWLMAAWGYVEYAHLKRSFNAYANLMRGKNKRTIERVESMMVARRKKQAE